VNGGWHILTNCTNVYNPVAGVGEITCQTPDFSIFGLFGEPTTQISTGTNVGGGSSSSSSNDEGGAEVEIAGEAEETVEEIVPDDELVEEMEEVTEEESQEVVSPEGEFARDLWWGNNNSDVLTLQRFLNANGFTLAQEGPGSPGRETSYFGERTFNAVKAFQSMYAASVLQPLGLSTPTGYFGYFTRTFINENF
jgi:hypothetical protein